MNFKIYKLFFILLAFGLFSACNNEDVDVSQVTTFPSYGFEGLPDKLEVQEVDSVYTFNFTFNENQITDVSIEIATDEASTATENVDFAIDHSISIPALGRSGSFTFEVGSDYVTEGDETVILNITSGEAHGYPVTHQMEITIKDIVSTDLILTFDWEGTFEYLGSTYTLCPNLDLDVYVLDADGNDLGIYDAATGACPEQIIISNWADGEYFFASNMYENGLAGLGLNVDFPLTMTAFKQDKFNVSVTPEVVWNSEEDDYNTGGNGSFKEVGSVVVTGNTYEVKGPDGTILATGVKAPNKANIK